MKYTASIALRFDFDVPDPAVPIPDSAPWDMTDEEFEQQTAVLRAAWDTVQLAVRELTEGPAKATLAEFLSARENGRIQLGTDRA